MEVSFYIQLGLEYNFYLNHLRFVDTPPRSLSNWATSDPDLIMVHYVCISHTEQC